MAKFSRSKGLRKERELVKRLVDAGIEAERVPLSGAAGGSYTGDVRIEAATGELTAELKARANGDGFRTLEGWLGNNDCLVLWRDRAAPFFVVPERVMHKLLKGEACDG